MLLKAKPMEIKWYGSWYSSILPDFVFRQKLNQISIWIRASQAAITCSISYTVINTTIYDEQCAIHLPKEILVYLPNDGLCISIPWNFINSLEMKIYQFQDKTIKESFNVITWNGSMLIAYRIKMIRCPHISSSSFHNKFIIKPESRVAKCITSHHVPPSTFQCALDGIVERQIGFSWKIFVTMSNKQRLVQNGCTYKNKCINALNHFDNFGTIEICSMPNLCHALVSVWVNF